jgi:hypothetical protein
VTNLLLSATVESLSENRLFRSALVIFETVGIDQLSINKLKQTPN